MDHAAEAQRTDLMTITRHALNEQPAPGVPGRLHHPPLPHRPRLQVRRLRRQQGRPRQAHRPRRRHQRPGRGAEEAGCAVQPSLCQGARQQRPHLCSRVRRERGGHIRRCSSPWKVLRLL